MKKINIKKNCCWRTLQNIVLQLCNWRLLRFIIIIIIIIIRQAKEMK